MTGLVIDQDDPASILRVGLAFGVAKAVLTAVELDLFDVLHNDGPADAAEIAAKLGLSARAVPRYLDVLVGAGLLRHDGGKYVNTPIVERYLLRSRPSHVRDLLERANHTHFAAWGRLTDALRTGGHQAEADYSVMRDNPKRLRRFLDLMDALTTPIAPLLAQAVDWSSVDHVVDVGGARGNLLSHLLLAHPHLRGTVVDLPHNAGPFAELAAARDLTDRMSFWPAEFFVDPLPAADALIFGHVLHDWSPQRRELLVRRAYDAIRPGGLLVIYEALLEEDPAARQDPLQKWEAALAQQGVEYDDPMTKLDRLLFSTEGGTDYTEQECRQLLHDVGFTVLDVRPLDQRDTLIVACRDEQVRPTPG